MENKTGTQAQAQLFTGIVDLSWTKGLEQAKIFFNKFTLWLNQHFPQKSCPSKSRATPRQTEEEPFKDYNPEENERLLNEAKPKMKINFNNKIGKTYKTNSVDDALLRGKYVCSVCGKISNTQAKLIAHKKNHAQHPICKYYLTQTCKFSKKKCWWTHPKGTTSSAITSGSISCSSTSSKKMQSHSPANSSASKGGLASTKVHAKVVLPQKNLKKVRI